MIRFASLTIAAAAVVIGVHSGSLTLALAALCGACGVASFADDVVVASRQSSVVSRQSSVANKYATRQAGYNHREL